LEIGEINGFLILKEARLFGDAPLFFWYSHIDLVLVVDAENVSYYNDAYLNSRIVV